MLFVKTIHAHSLYKFCNTTTRKSPNEINSKRHCRRAKNKMKNCKLKNKQKKKKKILTSAVYECVCVYTPNRCRVECFEKRNSKLNMRIIFNFFFFINKSYVFSLCQKKRATLKVVCRQLVDLWLKCEEKCVMISFSLSQKFIINGVFFSNKMFRPLKG